MEKGIIIQILENNRSDVDQGNWEDVYETISNNSRGEFSDFLIENGINANNLFRNYVPQKAFYGCQTLKSISLANSVKEIGDVAFAECKVQSITLPNSIQKIGVYAFSSSAIQSITLPNSIKEIGEDAFGFCKSLKSVTLSNSLKAVTDYAFEGCESLESVVIPNSVQEIRDGAFRRCYSLKSITLPHSLKKLVGAGVFEKCYNLQEVKYDGTKEEWEQVEKNEYWLFDSSEPDVTFLR